MKIMKFAEKYCPEVLKTVQNVNSLFTTDGFPYDELIIDDDGVKVPVLNTESFQIPLSDVFGMSRDEFIKAYSDNECIELYDRYLSAYTILEGADALKHMQDLTKELIAKQAFSKQYLNLAEFV